MMNTRRPVPRPRLSRRQVRLIAGLGFLMALGAFLWWGYGWLNEMMSASGTLTVRSVHIDGALRQVTRRQIADQLARYAAGANLPSLNLAELRQRLLADQPWIAQAALRKQMPDTLVVSVVEHVPAAYWNGQGLYDARTREVFYPDLSGFRQDLVQLGAARDSLAPEVYRSAVEFLRLLKGSELVMTSLYLDQVRSYTLTLSVGTRLRLGRGRELPAERLKRFLRSYRKAGLKLAELEYVDLRYDASFATAPRLSPAAETAP